MLCQKRHGIAHGADKEESRYLTGTSHRSVGGAIVRPEKRKAAQAGEQAAFQTTFNASKHTTIRILVHVAINAVIALAALVLAVALVEATR